LYSPVPYLLAAWALTYLPHVVGGAVRARMEGGYDNRTPRFQQAKLTGFGSRTVGAHQNSFEAFAPFAAATILCEVAGVDVATANWLSLGWVLTRAAYIGFYLADVHVARSTAWAIAALINVALFVVAWG
jgi:uncharacterized MAPEG superfamily protein